MNKILLMALALFSFSVHASSTTSLPPKENNSWLPNHGRASFSAGAVNIGVFKGDLMQPLYGQKDRFFYTDLTSSYGTNDTYLVSPGLGYRTICHNQILGAYFFGDYQKVSFGQDFWVMNPGLEWMNTHWDAHLNGYFPTTDSKQSGEGVFASNLGNYSSVAFEENTHNQYDNLLTPYDVIGNGIDAEVGYSFASLHGLRARVYLGGYYYQPNEETDIDNITGITAGFEHPLTKNWTLSLFNSYDKVNNYLVGVSITVTLDQDSVVFSNNIADRLLDPNERHVGIIGTGAGTYDQQATENAGQFLQYDNVYFVTPDASLEGNGTYGNPMSLTQASLDTIHASDSHSARIYLQGGSSSTYYVNHNTTTKLNPDGPPAGLHIYDGQSFYGRSTNYTAPASESEQPIIAVDSANNYNGFIMQGGENTFSDLNITSYSSGQYTRGILVYGEANTDTLLNIDHSTISGNAFTQGVYAENSSTRNLTLNITHSSLNHNGVVDGDTLLETPIAGLAAVNTSSGKLNIYAMNTAFNHNGIFTQNSAGYGGLGLYADSKSSGTLNILLSNSSLNNNGLFIDAAKMKNFSTGLYVINRENANLNLHIENTLLNHNAEFAGNTSIFSISASGATLLSNSTGETHVDIKNSEFNGNASLSGSSHLSDTNLGGLYIENDHSGEVYLNIKHSQFNNNANVIGEGEINSAYGSNSVSGLVIYNAAGAGEITATIDRAHFDDNGEVSGSGSITNGLISGMNAVANTSRVNLTATHSTFNHNGVVTGTGIIDVLPPISGLNVTALGYINYATLNVADLSGSTFNTNGEFGLLASAGGEAGGLGIININSAGTTFSGNGISSVQSFAGPNGIIYWE